MRHTLYASVALAALVAGGASAQDLTFTPGEGDFTWDSYNAWAENAPDLSGQTVTITGPWLQPEDGFFRSVIAYFAEATGAEVIYTGSDSFEQNIVIDAEAGAAPNVAVFPAPGQATSEVPSPLVMVQLVVAPSQVPLLAWIPVATSVSQV